MSSSSVEVTRVIPSSDTSPTDTVEGRAEQVPRRGSMLGRYLVIEELGRGAMGVVMRGYDPKLEREVALKLVRTRMVSADARALMIREARAMAKLSHPGVVGVYDVELVEDTVVLVMEFVAGQTLRSWLDGSRTVSEILAVFARAGAGLAAAHDAGLLHRDFKPDNVLVGADGRARVSDFGLARSDPSVDDRSTRRGGSDQTLTGDLDDEPAPPRTRASTVMGTPAYMAPEQHVGRELSAAADQFAFCVALWEALAGRRPFEHSELAGLVADKHQGPPPWPADAAVAVPGRIVAALRRGLSPEPEERFESMSALLAVLTHDPARRRRMLGLGAVVLGSVSITAALAGRTEPAPAEARCTGARAQLDEVWDEAVRQRARDAMLGVGVSYAQDAWALAEARIDGYADAWVAAHEDACRATTVRGELSASVMDLRMACLFRARAELSAVTGVLARADAQTIERAHELAGGLPRLERCADVDALTSGAPGPDRAIEGDVDRLHAELARARAERRAGRLADARPIVEAVLVEAEALGYGPLRAETQRERGLLLHELGDHEAAVQAARTALELALEHGVWDVAATAASGLMFEYGSSLQQHEVGLAYGDMAKGLLRRTSSYSHAWVDLEGSRAAVLLGRGEYQRAAELLREVLQVELEGDFRPETTAITRHNLANALLALGRYDEAETELHAIIEQREALLGPRHPVVAESRGTLGSVLHARGDYAGAEAEYRAVLEIQQDALGPEHEALAVNRYNLGLALSHRGRFAEAEAELSVALSINKKSLGPTHPEVARVHQGFASVYGRQGRHEDAAEHLRICLAIYAERLGDAHANTAAARHNLAATLLSMGQVEEGTAMLERAREAMAAALGPEHPAVAQADVTLGQAYAEGGRSEQAEVQFRRALASMGDALSDEHPEVVRAHYGLARLLAARGAEDEALVHAREVDGRLEALEPAERAQAALLLVTLRWDDPAARADGRAMVQEAREGLIELDSDDAREAAADIDRWLAAHGGR